jgi:hypothetical protein
MSVLAEACPDLFGTGWVGASWGYFAIACPPHGYNNFVPDIVAVNLTGPVNGWEALSSVSSEELTASNLTGGLRRVTFNSFALIDPSLLTNRGEGRDLLFLLEQGVGPKRGEVDSVN